MATQVNPANESVKVNPEDSSRKRRPMTMAAQKLEVPSISGFHLYWFADRNVPRALEAGYQFVDSKEIPVVQRNPANDARSSGNVDLGSNVKVVGGEGARGQTEYLTLMKIKEEWYNKDHAELAKKNARILESIFTGERIIGSERDSAEDSGARYINVRGHKPLFNRPKRMKRV